MDKNMREFFIEHQYELPKKLYHHARKFPNVTFIQALKLYSLAVEEILTLYNAKHLYDTPLSFGRGLFVAECEWLKKMIMAEEIQKRNKI